MCAGRVKFRWPARSLSHKTFAGLAGNLCASSRQKREKERIREGFRRQGKIDIRRFSRREADMR